MSEPTYRALIRPIPARLNLSNVSNQEACEPCKHCAILVPDRSKAKNGLIKTPYERIGIDIYPDFPELKSSANAGCGLCRIIRKTTRSAWAVRPMEEWGVGPLSEKNSYWDDLFTSTWDRKVKIYGATFWVVELHSTPQTSPIEGSSTMVVSLGMKFGTLMKDLTDILSYANICSPDLEASTEEFRRRLPCGNPLSTSNFTMLLEWIKNCKSSYQACQVKETSWLPGRLLDVGPSDGSKSPRLVDTSSKDIKGTFTALSHMWGDMSKRPPLRTLRSNYHNITLGIYMSALPKNFRQAIIVTRLLGIRFLWIDSLCIIQDMPSDWAKEAGTMHKVYQYAEVTLIATSAISTHDGFLERTLPLIPAVKTQYTLGNASGKTFNMILSAQDDQDSGNWSGGVEGRVWNTRGWTLQVRSLSTRSIHFCKNNIYFKCRHCRLSEENEPFLSYPQFSKWPREEESMENPNSVNVEAARKDILYALWRSTVANYTQRSLTKGSDKLPAIQSTSSQMASSIDDEYITAAGMWANNLVHDLLWQVKDGMSSRPEEYRAPTWSWAAVDAKIAWNRIPVKQYKELRSLKDGTCRVLSSYHHFRNHLECVIEIKGFVQPLAFINEFDEDDRWIYFSRAVMPYDLYIHSTNIPLLETEGRKSLFSTSQARYAAIDNGEVVKFAEGRLDLDNKDNVTFSSAKLYYLLLTSAESPSGLILEARDAEGWKRVGVASLFAEDKRRLI